MRKLFTLVLALTLVLPVLALAELPDVTGMSDQELKDLIAACSAELTARNANDPEGTLLFDAGGMRMYQTGEAYIDNGILRIPVIIYNDLDERAAISLEDEKCNDCDITGNGGAETKAKSKKKAEMYFFVADANVKEITDITSLSFRWTVFSMESRKTLYEQKEAEEHRFW